MTPPTTPHTTPHQTLRTILADAAARRPDAGIGIYDRRGRALERRTWPELQLAVEQRAARLASLGLEPGATLILALDTSFELVETWLATVALGARPLAMAPVGAMGSGAAHLSKLEGVVERVDARFVVGVEALRTEAEREGCNQLSEAVLTEAEIQATLPAGELPELAPDPDEVAFFQLTSGSTGSPRAVSIPHRAVLHNLHAIERAIDDAWGQPVRERGRSVVSWLPLHHDMGLVGCMLATLRSGLELTLLPPRAFLARPRTWLDALARAGACVSSAPNFGYQTCLEHELPELDGSLSEWHTALVGAEMVRPETMAAFAERHAALGFDPRALRPCYGLAEATLAVTFDTENRGVRTAPAPVAAGEAPRAVACLGRPVEDTELAVVAPDGRALADGELGEVKVRGPGLFAGYHGDAEATAECVREGWLFTGDLGFVREGELYLTGRKKDLLIVRGQNLMPHELEWCAEAELGAGGTARAGAFSIDAGAQGEAAVIAVETTESEPERLAELARAVRVRIGHELGLTLADVVFLRRGRIPKTTSGKVQRGELRRRYVAGELERVDEAGSSGP